MGELGAEAALEDYTKKLRSATGPGRMWPRFDQVWLGMGSDGHTASLFPRRNNEKLFREPAMIVEAAYAGRPAYRITLTPPVFNDARQVVFLVTGRDKAAALAAVLRGEYLPDRWPAQMIRPEDGRVFWLVDREAAHLLPS
jgi:6-phosphogluconolactonase